MKWFYRVLFTLLAFSLTSCVNSTTDSKQARWVYPPMARPLQTSVEQEVQIARLSQFLTRRDLSDDVRAKLFFERGNYYDVVGLRNLSRLDLEQSLGLNPKQPDAFNMLGVYYTETGNFDAAYQAFDSALELDPDNIYAERNEAIALYYGERPRLAYDLITKDRKQVSSDPFHLLWLYIIERDIHPDEAKQHLKTAYQTRDNDLWGWLLVGMMVGEVSDVTAFETILNSTSKNTLLAQRLTETYFYLAKRYEFEGKNADALAFFKLAVSFNVYEYVEHRYAFLEMERIYKELKKENSRRAKSSL